MALPLRYSGLGLLAAVAWAVSSASATGVNVAATMLLVVGFLLVFWDPPFARWAYLGVAALTAAAIVIGGLIAGHRGGAEFAEGLLAGLGVFLAIAVPSFVISRMLPLINEVKIVGRLVGRYGKPDEGFAVWTLAMSASYGVPIGVASGLIIGLSIGGPTGLIVGVLVGALGSAVAAQVGFGAGMWRIGRVPGPVELIESERFLKHASQAPVDILSMLVAAIATVVLGFSDVAEFTLSLALEVVVGLLVAGWLAVAVPHWVILRVDAFPTFGDFIRTLKVVVIGAGAAIGIALGVFTTAALLVPVELPDGAGTLSLAAVVAVAAFIALALGRLGAVVGLAIGSTIAVVGGDGVLPASIGDWATDYLIFATGLIGMVGGMIVYEFVDVFLGTAGSEQGGLMGIGAFLTFGGALAAVIAGVAVGIGAM